MIEVEDLIGFLLRFVKGGNKFFFVSKCYFVFLGMVGVRGL